MRLRPSRLIALLLLLLLLSNFAWLMNTRDHAAQLSGRDTALLGQARGLAQLRVMAAASLTGQRLADIQPVLQKLFPGVAPQRSARPSALIFGEIALALDEGETITGVYALADLP